MEWLRTVDLSEYAPNLRGSGVHGGLMMYEPRFNADLMATLLNIPPNKTLLRRHLSTQFKQLIGPDVMQKKREWEAQANYTPLSPSAKLKSVKGQRYHRVCVDRLERLWNFVCSASFKTGELSAIESVVSDITSELLNVCESESAVTVSTCELLSVALLTGWSTHPSEHLKPNQISFEDREAYIARKDIINIFTDVSETEQGVGAAFCVLANDIWAYQWSAKLSDNNTVCQVELTALHEAVIYASHLPNHNTSKIHVDNRASIMASSNSKSTNETARNIFKILLSNSRIKVSWVKAHAGNIGNERADQLAKYATQHGQPYSHTKLPKPHIKGLLRKRMLEECQTSWKNGDTGRKFFNIMPSVSLRPTNWIREDVIFFSQHGPFPAYLKRFHLSDSDYCSCGGIGTALHYATECIYTVSGHMRKPAPNFEQEWLKRVANNLVSRQKIRGIIKFISENRYLFRPP
ncbi:Liprin-beta-2 [Araneus ventricosus]|uniref:Liprin-beta-2 n=1 Tax=Araneus ventricosus TaxID=182803 RepID=A0A4Y2PC61_ARAVE|nr:Liprin-beta-2 [Araneus ventricosus]